MLNNVLYGQRSVFDNYIDLKLQHRLVNAKAMFGGVGLFYSKAMFVLFEGERLYLRGGGALDAKFIRLSCRRFEQHKKTVSVTVNYYDVTDIFEADRNLFFMLEAMSIAQSLQEKQKAQGQQFLRIRDLPNMRLTLERMLKKVGIVSLEQFLSAAPVQMFIDIRSVYGRNVDGTLLLKLTAAQQGIPWQLLPSEKQRVLREWLKKN